MVILFGIMKKNFENESKNVFNKINLWLYRKVKLNEKTLKSTGEWIFSKLHGNVLLLSFFGAKKINIIHSSPISLFCLTKNNCK